MAAQDKSNKETLYVCQINILRVTDVPVADFNDLSCDPYIQARLSAETSTERSPDSLQVINYRTHTCRRTLHPEFSAQWIVSGVPESGFLLSLRLRDEDPGNYDDDLGKTVLQIPNTGEGKLHEGWDSGEREYKVHKRKGNIMSKIFTMTAQVVTWGGIGHRVRLWLSVKVLEKCANQDDRRLYTVGPRRYVRHFSPLIGIFLGSANSPDSGDRGAKVKPTAFVANRLQLAGPVPSTLRHRYVGFAPFVKAMFRRSGIRGMILHHTLHKQHLSVYKWDKNVVWGVIGDERGIENPAGEEAAREKKGEENNTGGGEQGGGSPDRKDERALETSNASIAMAHQFLRMTSHGTHHRIFTYVIMLDGEWRFTETGEQLAIEFLSKHTMHSDVAIEIAYSGEFFVRPLRHRKRELASDDPAPTEPEPPSNDARENQKEQGAGSTRNEPNEQESGDAPDQPTFDDDNPPDDPSLYELVIDNDSGTYRPREDLLPTLHSYLASSRNLGALGRVSCMNAFDDRLVKWKDARKKSKKEQGHKAVQPRGSLSSSASSSVSSLSDLGVNQQENGDQKSLKVGDMNAVVEEDAKRARDNQDEDTQAKLEENQVPAKADSSNGGK